MTTENRELAPATAPAATAAAPGTSNLKSLAFGAYAASAVLAIYSIIQMLDSMIHHLLPYVAGGALFITLSTIFLSIIASLKKYRTGARKSIAVIDTYAALAAISVLGYFAAACVGVFQPGAPSSELWSNGALAAICWTALFGGGKYVGELFRGDKN